MALGQHSLHCCWYCILDSYQTGFTLLFSSQLFFYAKIIKSQTFHILSKKQFGQVLPNSSSLFKTNFFFTSLHLCLYFKAWIKSNLGGKSVFSMHVHSSSVRKLSEELKEEWRRDPWMKTASWIAFKRAWLALTT